MLVNIVAILQIVIGVLLMVGTISLTQTAYQTVRDESRQLTDNLSAAADAPPHTGQTNAASGRTPTWMSMRRFSLENSALSTYQGSSRPSEPSIMAMKFFTMATLYNNVRPARRGARPTAHAPKAQARY